MGGVGQAYHMACASCGGKVWKPAFHWLKVSLPDGEKQPAVWLVLGFRSSRLTLDRLGNWPLLLRFSPLGQSEKRKPVQLVMPPGGPPGPSGCGPTGQLPITQIGRA